MRAPFGCVGIVMRDDALAEVSFLGSAGRPVAPRSASARRVCRQLRDYFRDPTTRFRVRLAVEGTAFQQGVWRALQHVPAGRPLTYGALARQLKTSARAVGNACRRNPVPIVVPCHRVVAVDGDGGFMGRRNGHALNIKRWLLAHERDR